MPGQPSVNVGAAIADDARGQLEMRQAPRVSPKSKRPRLNRQFGGELFVGDYVGGCFGRRCRNAFSHATRWRGMSLLKRGTNEEIFGLRFLFFGGASGKQKTRQGCAGGLGNGSCAIRPRQWPVGRQMRIASRRASARSLKRWRCPRWQARIVCSSLASGACFHVAKCRQYVGNSQIEVLF